MADSQTSSKTPLIILLILSVVLNSIQFFSSHKKSGEIKKLSIQVDSLTQATASLSTKVTETSTKLEETSTELDEFKGLSHELDSLLDVAKKDIKQKEARIRELKKDASKAKELEAEVAALRQLKERYMEQIDSLITANNLLKEEVATAQVNIQQLTEIAQQQQKTIEKGSILGADNVTAVPYKQKSSGKFATTAIASKTKRIEVCFDLLENKIAQPGEKTVYLQVISPEGVTLGTDATGAGEFTAKDDNSQNRYTTMAKIDYQNQRKNYCVGWNYDLPLAKGSYSVKVYTDGYFSGVGAFILK
ncbi:MAG TPA: hypothetical protein VNJ07_03775 [Chitinophagales bacterium]|nr:hypothetical protein [Chitinophagales bacterium]